MPELPEVEARAKWLRRWMSGHRIVKVLPPDNVRQRARLSPAEFVHRVRGHTVQSVQRKGKWILVKLSGGGLGIHLGMTGDLERDKQAQGAHYARADFGLESGSWVHFTDPRRFGKLIAASSYEDLLRNSAISEIGPDALSELTLGHLCNELARSTRAIKEVLMDQHAMSGIGNVYATEALWVAKIHPDTRANRISHGQAQDLFGAIRTVLKRALKAYGRRKEFETCCAYGRAGLPCPRCGTRLKSSVIGGRTTAFCPKEQTRRRADLSAPADRMAPTASSL